MTPVCWIGEGQFLKSVHNTVDWPRVWDRIETGTVPTTWKTKKSFNFNNFLLVTPWSVCFPLKNELPLVLTFCLQTGIEKFQSFHARITVPNLFGCQLHWEKVWRAVTCSDVRYCVDSDSWVFFGWKIYFQAKSSWLFLVVVSCRLVRFMHCSCLKPVCVFRYLIALVLGRSIIGVASANE